jgi:hypothetical protein
LQEEKVLNGVLKKGGYVYGNAEDSESSFGGSGKTSAPVDPQLGAEPEDDMPF